MMLTKTVCILYACLAPVIMVSLAVHRTHEESSFGLEFAIAFPPIQNDDKDGICAVIINARRTADIRISTPSGTVEDKVYAGTPYRYDAPCIDRTERDVEQKVIYVTSSDYVTVMAANSVGFDGDYGQMDASLIYPKRRFNREFYLLIYTDPSEKMSSCGLTYNTASYYVISAFEDGTEIEIYQSKTFKLIYRGQLQRFESYTNITTVSNRMFDFSGTYIRSSKPVSVSAGSACTMYTSTSYAEGGVTWGSVQPVQALSLGSHITHETWQEPEEFYKVMVLAVEDDTAVTIAGNDFSLNRGEKRDYELHSTFDSVYCHKPCYVIQVKQNVNDGGGIFQNDVSAVSQYKYRAILAPAPTYYDWIHYAVITVPTSNYGAIQWSGLDVNGTSWKCLDAVDACQIRATIDAEQAQIWSTDARVKFAAVVFAQGQDGEGYGYNPGYSF